MKYRVACAKVALLAGLVLSGAAGAQILSSPMGSDKPIPAGEGPGVHGANSTFPPLVPRADVVPWSVLTDVTVKFAKPRMVTTFSDAIKKLHGTKVKVQGYMTPIEPGTTHTHFLLLSVPPTCPFCMPGGAESMIEVRSSEPLKYTQNAIVVQGKLQVLENDPQGLYYRMTGARSAK